MRVQFQVVKSPSLYSLPSWLCPVHSHTLGFLNAHFNIIFATTPKPPTGPLKLWIFLSSWYSKWPAHVFILALKNSVFCYTTTCNQGRFGLACLLYLTGAGSWHETGSNLFRSSWSEAYRNVDCREKQITQRRKLFLRALVIFRYVTPGCQVKSHTTFRRNVFLHL